jgi:CRISPR/Cas system CMR-associated protein Cmr1 (group 7 of RAMP superfamily)
MSISKVNIYSYTAAANPYLVRSLAHKYGYTFDKDQPLSSVLQQLVSYEGEPVLFDIIENNPDRELFEDYFKKKYAKELSLDKNKDDKMAQAYMNFTGHVAAAKQSAENKQITTETSLMILAGAVLIAFSIFARK